MNVCAATADPEIAAGSAGGPGGRLEAQRHFAVRLAQVVPHQAGRLNGDLVEGVRVPAFFDPNAGPHPGAKFDFVVKGVVLDQERSVGVQPRGDLDPHRAVVYLE